MATEVDDLIVRIRADTKQLEDALKKVESNSKKAGRGASTAFARVLTSVKAINPAAVAAAGAITGAFAITGIVNVGREFENLKVSLNTVFGSAAAGKQAFDDIQKFAMESPFQVQDLTQAFIQLKAAGIEPTKRQLDIFTDASSVTTDSLGAFQTMVRILQRSTSGGLGLEELNQIADRGIPVFEILTEKLGRTRLNLSDLGQTAEGAAQIMAALEEGLEERFGGATAAKMETLNQKLSNMQTAFNALGNSFYEEGGVGAGIKSIVDDITSAVTELNTLFQMASTGMSRDFVTATSDEDRRKVLQKEIDAADSRKQDTEGLDKRERVQAVRRNTAIDDSIRAQKQELDLLNQRIADTKKANETQQENLEISRKNTELAKAQAESEAARVKRAEELKNLIDSTIPASDILRGKISELRAILETGEAPKLLEVFGTEDMDVINGNLAILDERLKAITESEASANLKAIAKDVEDVAITMSGEMQQAIINTSQAFTGDFVNALMDGKDALQSFKDFAKSLVAQIIQIFLQMAVVNNILNSVFNLTGANALPTINSIGGGSTSSIPTSGAGSFAADIANPNYFGARLAGGGAYQKGMPMLVGERGAELMIPNTSGTVANAQQTRSMLGGSNPIVVNQNLNFSLGVVPTVRAEIQKQLPTIANTAKVAVLEGVQRGGSYRKGIHGV